MNAIATQLLQSAMSLPVADRLALAEALLQASVPAQDHAVDAKWIEEAKRRCDELDAGHETLTPWSEARAQVREQLGRG